MAWTASAIFRPFVADILSNTQAFDLDVDSVKAALWQDTITPNNDVASAASAYAGGVWVSATNEVYQAGQWAQAGVALASQTVNSASADVVFFDAADTASGTAFTTQNSAASAVPAYGVLVYDDTVSDMGICYNYLGGPNSVTTGTFTVVWHANGILRFTL